MNPEQTLQHEPFLSLCIQFSILTSNSEHPLKDSLWGLTDHILWTTALKVDKNVSRTQAEPWLSLVNMSPRLLSELEQFLFSLCAVSLTWTHSSLSPPPAAFENRWHSYSVTCLDSGRESTEQSHKATSGEQAKVVSRESADVYMALWLCTTVNAATTTFTHSSEDYLSEKPLHAEAVTKHVKQSPANALH